MNRLLPILFFLLFLPSCNSSITGASQPDGITETTPAPYFPDTPSPAEIEAAQVEAPAFLRLEMLSELEGWAVTEAEIVRTNDGGLTWYDVTPPGMEETGYGVDTFILDARNAWVQKPDFDNFPNAGSLYRTTDGGLSWTSYSVPFSRGDLNFVDPDHGWMLADLGVGAGSNAVAIYQTTTGGAVWEQMYTNDPNDPEAGESLPLGGLKSDLVPLDMERAWVTGTVYAPGEVYLHRTEDGGRTWALQPVALPEDARNFELGIEDGQMKFVSDTRGYFALRMSGESIQTVIYVTEDAGNTWTFMPEVITGAGPSDFLSGQEGILFHGEQFYVTRDAARTWNTVTPDIVFDESFIGMDFVNTLSGWVITMDPSNRKSLYRTEDGGTTWQPVLP